MSWQRVVPVVSIACFLLVAGCSSAKPTHGAERHEGPKVNVADFISNTAAYKGKTITLTLKIDEALAGNPAQSLRGYAGKDVKFAMSVPKGEKLNLVIKIPTGLTVPEAANSDEVRVTFVCTRGSLRQGNEARTIALP